MEDEVIEVEKKETVSQSLKLNTHTNIQKNNAYTILSLSPNQAVVMLESDKCERVKENGLIYDGTLLSAATFTATAAVNEKNMFVIGVDIDFLNPIKEDAQLIFTATVQATVSGKKNVTVVGTINDIEFLRGTLMLLKFDDKSLIK